MNLRGTQNSVYTTYLKNDKFKKIYKGVQLHTLYDGYYFNLFLREGTHERGRVGAKGEGERES